jgi:NADH-quinone oxidoreductase subunit G
MPNIYIDGKKVEAKDGQTIIEAAFQNGINIPHFCWHPELSVSGNCRMCLVEVGMPKKFADGSIERDENGHFVVGYFPKLQIACSTQISDNMHVKTVSENAVKAQESVSEFILINHPLDCPICDEAGQCKLQEYAFNHSRGESRFEETKNHNVKRVSWGPNVIFDGERCITCSRCIRFSNEVANQEVLTFAQRGDKVTIQLFEGTQLDNPYSMNVIDICPVGALTSKDFRFKSRVWDMSFNESICNSCGKGCNIKVGVRNNEVLRIEPRPNHYVNNHWMCDYGRLNPIDKINEKRVLSPMVKVNGKLSDTTWDNAISTAIEKLKKFKPSEVMFVGSAFATNEDNYLYSKFVKTVFKSHNLDSFVYINESFADKKLRVSDKTPNSTGMKEIYGNTNTHGVEISLLKEKIDHHNIKAIYIIDDNFASKTDFIPYLDKLELVIVHSSNHNAVTDRAHIVFALSNFAENEGTITNINKRVQHFAPALTTKENLRFMGMKMSRLDKFGANNDRWTNHDTRDTKAIWSVIQKIANSFNANWSFSSVKDVFEDLTHHIESFKGMTYNSLKEYQGLVLGKGTNPDKKVKNYESHYMKP